MENTDQLNSNPLTSSSSNPLNPTPLNPTSPFQKCLTFINNNLKIFVTILTLVIIFVVCILLVILLPHGKNFYDIPEISKTLDIQLKISDELHNEIHTTATKLLKDTTVLPLLHDKNILYEKEFKNLHLYLNSFDVKSAGIFCIKQFLIQEPKNGCDIMTNDTLRFLYPIQINSPKKNFLNCDGEIKALHSKEWLCYDASRINNFSNKDRYNNSLFLFIDIYRPKTIPLGASKNSTDFISEEFDNKKMFESQ